MAKNGDKGAPWWAVVFALVALIGLIVAYFVLRAPTIVHHLSWHAELATALGPVTGVLSLFAVVAALWSVELQRRAMAGQQQEIDRHMRLLEEQREQFTRSADAHAALAQATAALATAQKNANREATALRLAQYSNTIGLLLSARIAQGTALVAHASEPNTDFRKTLLKSLDGVTDTLKQRQAQEEEWEAQLRTLVATGKPDA